MKPTEIGMTRASSGSVAKIEPEPMTEGRQLRRVVLDEELKARAYRALHEGHKEENPDADLRGTVAAVQVARLLDLETIASSSELNRWVRRRQPVYEPNHKVRFRAIREKRIIDTSRRMDGTRTAR